MKAFASKPVSLALAVATLFGLALLHPAQAADRNFTLFGSETEGWGLTNLTMSNPGPAITVDLGDNVTLVLNSTDGPNHNWFVDYDSDGSDDPTEPNSPNFQSTQITWNFTADRAGTFMYRCKFHPTTMEGTIVIRESSPPGGGAGASDNTALIVGGVIVAAIAVLGLAYFMMKRKPNKRRSS